MNFSENSITGTVAKAADRYAIDVLGMPSLELMERASRHVTDYIISSFHEEAKDAVIPAVILCSVGNNGADGVCIARQLLDDDKRFHTAVVVCGNPEKSSWEFLHQLSEYKRRGGQLQFFLPDAAAGSGDSSDSFSSLFSSARVIVDALFGIGLHRPVEGNYRALIEAANAATPHPLCIAVDVPSGINADDGRCMGTCFHADVTLTFGKNKTGLLVSDGPAAAGEVKVCDIGIPEKVYQDLMTSKQ